MIRVIALLHNQVAQLGKPKGAFVGSAVFLFTLLTTPQDVGVTLADLALADARLDAVHRGRVAPGKRPRRRGVLQMYTVTGGTGRFAHAVGTAEKRSRVVFAAPNVRFLVFRLRLR